MRTLSDTDAARYGIGTAHHEMDNGEMRFRLVSETGGSYILTKSGMGNGWQNAHVHYRKKEHYIVERGFAVIAMLVDGQLKVEKLSENDSFSVPVGVPHNVLMSDNAILHTVKFGTKETDWNGCAELDAMLAGMELQQFLDVNEAPCIE